MGARPRPWFLPVAPVPRPSVAREVCAPLEPCPCVPESVVRQNRREAAPPLVADVRPPGPRSERGVGSLLVLLDGVLGVLDARLHVLTGRLALGLHRLRGLLGRRLDALDGVLGRLLEVLCGV